MDWQKKTVSFKDNGQMITLNGHYFKYIHCSLALQGFLHGVATEDVTRHQLHSWVLSPVEDSELKQVLQ